MTNGYNDFINIIFSYYIMNNYKLLQILVISSVLKPFITDITMIKTATPKEIPIKEKIEMIFKKPSFFLVLKNLNVTSLSRCEINLI